MVVLSVLIDIDIIIKDWSTDPQYRLSASSGASIPNAPKRLLGRG